MTEHYCPKCSREVSELVAVGEWTEYNLVCGHCVRKHSLSPEYIN